MARRATSGSLRPIAGKEIAPEEMWSAWAAMPPMTMASSVRSLIHSGKMPVQPAVGLAFDATLVSVPAAAPTVSSRVHDSSTPRPDHQAIAVLLGSGVKYRV